MVKNLIVTVLGKTSGYKPVNYRYLGESNEDYLASVFFRKVSGYENFFHLFFLPDTMEDTVEDLEILDENKNYQVFLFPSIVPDDKAKYHGFTFNANYELIQFNFFLKMVDFYLKHPEIENIYIDISIGLNLYNDALREAIRNFSVFAHLMKFKSERKVNIYLLYSDPVIGQQKRQHSIFTVKIPVKVWFSSPIRKEDLNKDSINKLNLEKNIVKIIKNYYYSYISIYRNHPLIVQYFGFDSPQVIYNELSKLVHQFLEIYGIQPGIYIQKKYNLPENIEDIKLMQAIIQSLGLYHNISNNLLMNGFSTEATEMIELNKIKNFEKIYSFYEMVANWNILERDIQNLLSNSKKLHEGQAQPLINLEQNNKRTSKINKRNFLAHSGFEANITLLMKQSGKVYVGYDSKYKDKLKNCIFEE